MYILNEKLFAERLLKEGFWYKKQIGYQIQILCRYFNKELNQNLYGCINTIIKLLHDNNDIVIRTLSNKETIKFIENSWKVSHPEYYRNDKYIFITKNEQNKLDQIENLQIRKFIFILLILYKQNKHKPIIINVRDLFNLSKINIKANERFYFIGNVKKTGLINMPKYDTITLYKDNNNNRIDETFEITFADTNINEDNILYKLLNTNDLGKDSILQQWINLSKCYKTTKCKLCGKEIKLTNNGINKYCKDCKKIIEKERIRTYRKSVRG